MTYAALAEQATRFAAGLAAAGVGRERRIALVMLDTVDFPAAFWGAIGAGVIPVPVNTLLTPEQTAYILADSRAELLVVSAPLLPPLRPLLARLPALRGVVVAGVDGTPTQDASDWHDFLPATPAPLVEVSADEVAFWLYSSGSTGLPKGARHVHASLRATADTYAAQVLGITQDDTVYSAAKLFFAYGLGNGMTFPMSVGASAVLLPDRPTPDAVLATMARFRPSIFGGVPTLYAALLAHPGLTHGAGSERLRRCISAGEALPEAVARRWVDRTGVDILDGLGSTEMLHIFVSNTPDDIGYGATGRAVPGYQLRIVDANGADVADGIAGELIVRGPTAADGYWNQREKSRATFRGAWTWTGDTYVRDAEGRYRYQGRADDMMKVGGIWVSPFEVEAALLTHPGVLEAAVVGEQDADGLTKPKAFLVTRDAGTDADQLRAELKAMVQEQIGVWKYPRWIELVDNLPKTATGKIQRYKLRGGG